MRPEAKRILVCSAWPYGSGVPHLGNLIGCLLSGDAFTRFYRLAGYEVLHVSGTDAHGTKIEYEAYRQGISPAELAARVHEEILGILRAFEVDIDNYTTTESPVHKEVVTALFKEMEENGYIFSQEEERAYCQSCRRFLADRFIVGTCPKCGYPYAQGNQCDACGALLEPEMLISARCAFCGSQEVVRRPTRHWYLDLGRLAPKLLEYVRSRDFQGNVKLFTERMIEEGLRPRAVTRDIAWGIPAPFRGAEGKVIYVWAEAVLGYLSATVEHFRRRGQEERWREFWYGEEVFQIYTQGKDNIPFHTVILPALLLATGRPFHLPDQISATEYLGWEGGEQFSKTRRIGVFADEALQLLPPVYWRFHLFYNRPETRDAEFSWVEFEKAANAVLVDNVGNFVHRVLSYVWNKHDGVVPDAATVPEVQAKIAETLREVWASVGQAKLAPALRAAVRLGEFGNRFFQARAPWQTGDTEAVASAAHLVKALAVFLDPFVPMFSREIYELLGITQPTLSEAEVGCRGVRLSRPPQPLLSPVDVEDLKRRYAMMKEEGLISLEEFQRVDLRVARIVHAEEIPGAEKLLRLVLDLGDRQVQVVAGIRKHYRPEELRGRLVAMVANLKPAIIRGVRSEGMILAAADGTLALIGPDREVEPGARIK